MRMIVVTRKPSRRLSKSADVIDEKVVFLIGCIFRSWVTNGCYVFEGVSSDCLLMNK